MGIYRPPSAPFAAIHDLSEQLSTIRQKGCLIYRIISSRMDGNIALGVFELGFSDHCPIACIRHIRKDVKMEEI